MIATHDIAIVLAGLIVGLALALVAEAIKGLTHTIDFAIEEAYKDAIYNQAQESD